MTSENMPIFSYFMLIPQVFGNKTRKQNRGKNEKKTVFNYSFSRPLLSFYFLDSIFMRCLKGPLTKMIFHDFPLLSGFRILFLSEVKNKKKKSAR